MRTALAALLTVLVLPLAACDTGNDASTSVPDQPNVPDLRVVEPPTAQLVAMRDSLIVDLATVFSSSTTAAIAYALVSGPQGSRLSGSRLAVPPQPAGAVEARVRGSFQGLAKETSIRAMYAYAGRITAVKAFDPLALDARKDSAVYDLSTYFAVPPGVTATYTVSGAGASVSGTMLKVKPYSGGTSNVVVRASAPGIEAATATLAINAKSDWCITPPAETFDPLPFQVGETVKFDVSNTSTGNYGRYRRVSKGTLTWTILQRSCAYGNVLLAIQAHTVTADTTFDQTAGTTIGVTNLTVQHNVTVPATGTLPAIGKVFTEPVSQRWTPAAGDRQFYHPGVQVSKSWVVRSDASGLISYLADSSDPSTQVSFFVTRR